MRYSFFIGFLFLSMLTTSITFAQDSEPVSRKFTNSTTLATFVNEIAFRSEELKSARRDITSLIKQKAVTGSKRVRARIFILKSKRLFRKLRKALRALDKVLERFIKDEQQTGELSEKAKKQVIPAYTNADKQAERVDALVERMKLFYQDNRPVPAARFGGDWNTNFGLITIAQFNNNKVTGTYFYSGGGTIRGKVRGNVMSGKYSDANGTGRFSVTMNSNGSSWSGGFTADEGGSGSWSATR